MSVFIVDVDHTVQDDLALSFRQGALGPPLAIGFTALHSELSDRVSTAPMFTIRVHGCQLQCCLNVDFPRYKELLQLLGIRERDRSRVLFVHDAKFLPDFV